MLYLNISMSWEGLFALGIISFFALIMFAYLVGFVVKHFWIKSRKGDK